MVFPTSGSRNPLAKRRRTMWCTRARPDTPAATEYATVCLVFELSKAKWMLGVMLPGSEKLSRYTITGGDLTALASRLASLRAKAGRGGKPVRILSCYEAGLDGHWLHRRLTRSEEHTSELQSQSNIVCRPLLEKKKKSG